MKLLMLFMGAAPESENKIAKEKLLCYFCGVEYKGKTASMDKNKWW